MYITVTKEQHRDNPEVIESLSFKVNFNKTIVYKEKDDSFYVKDGDGDLTVKEISVKIPHEDKAAIVRVEPYMMKNSDSAS